jgi:hypothetical protein
MEVDTDPRSPKLTQVLSRCLRYPTTEASMRTALRQQFKDIRQLLPVLDILDNWLDRWSERGPLIGFTLEGLETREAGSHVQKDTKKIIRNIEKRTGMPAPEHVGYEFSPGTYLN